MIVVIIIFLHCYGIKAVQELDETRATWVGNDGVLRANNDFAFDLYSKYKSK